MPRHHPAFLTFITINTTATQPAQVNRLSTCAQQVNRLASLFFIYISTALLSSSTGNSTGKGRDKETPSSAKVGHPRHSVLQPLASLVIQPPTVSTFSAPLLSSPRDRRTARHALQVQCPAVQSIGPPPSLSSPTSRCEGCPFHLSSPISTWSVQNVQPFPICVSHSLIFCIYNSHNLTQFHALNMVNVLPFSNILNFTASYELISFLEIANALAYKSIR
jgi:hypothetical protein